jgi:hypothetical protein
MKRKCVWLVFLICLIAIAAGAQQASPPAKIAPPSKVQSPEFLKAADEVLADMSKLLSLPILSPLKKSLRTREEIRDYILRQIKEDKEPEKRYADQKTLEKFGLIPKGFPLEKFLVDLLTEQIAGLYDPKSQEFFIAEWIEPEEQRTVMAHELTHALQDQHFHVQKWQEAAKPNDDAQMARDAVLEGSALAAMFDYQLQGRGITVRELPDIGRLAKGEMLGEAESSPLLAKAPPFIRNELLFPYLSGVVFTQKVLQANSGWADFQKVFANPPVSTQQILHPELYLKGVAPEKVTLPDVAQLLPRDWKKLDENLMGEFGLREVLKQTLGEDRAVSLASLWAGDRYMILENQKGKDLLLVFRLRLAGEVEAARFFGTYCEALEKKYENRRELFRRPNFFSFQTEEGGVFLRCVGDQCVSAEGTDRATFDKITRAIGWPAGPAAPAEQGKTRIAFAPLIIPRIVPQPQPILFP